MFYWCYMYCLHVFHNVSLFHYVLLNSKISFSSDLNFINDWKSKVWLIKIWILLFVWALYASPKNVIHLIWLMTLDKPHMYWYGESVLSLMHVFVTWHDTKQRPVCQLSLKTFLPCFFLSLSQTSSTKSRYLVNYLIHEKVCFDN